MTTPRDAIGLSERLLRHARFIDHWNATSSPERHSALASEAVESAPVMLEAATALDALSAENEHMADTIIKLNEYLTDANARTEQAEAMVKELERESDGYKRLYNDEVVERLRAEKQRDAAESRATSAEQERDEALKRLKPFAYAAESLDESHLDRMDLWESPSGLEITAGHLRAARDLVRRLAAGTEKEEPNG